MVRTIRIGLIFGIVNMLLLISYTGVLWPLGSSTSWPIVPKIMHCAAIL